MPNFFEDNEDLQFLFEHLDIAGVATVQEDGFTRVDGPGREYAPVDAADAVDNYRRILSITGGVAGNSIAPRAESIDREGNVLEDDGTVTLNPGVRENLDVLARADLMGFMLPRRYGGLNFPNIVYTMAIEIVSRADASLMNLFGLQGIGETINAFANQAIKDEYLPRFVSGEATGAMALTEPDAGSDLQAIALRAWQNDDGEWRLTGVKRFITNGCGDVVLTLARSEPDIKDGRGLSLFLAGPGPRLKVRHLETKLGIHGSPTCELVYDDCPAKLIGERQLGLIRYVMSLMNGARLGIAAQSLGVAEAAFRVARTYAHTRKQFGTAIEKLPAVAEMVTDMKIAIEAARALVYETSRVCDLETNNLRVLEELAEQKSSSPPAADKEEIKRRKGDARVLKRLGSMLTPMSKYYASEMCVKVAGDALQVLGGSGYMADYPVERHLRDARITTIYEGTSQLQIVAAVRGVCAGTFEKFIEEFEQHEYLDKQLGGLKQKLAEGKELVLKGIAAVKQHGANYMDLHGRKLVDSALAVLIGHLLLKQASATAGSATGAAGSASTNVGPAPAAAGSVTGTAGSGAATVGPASTNVGPASQPVNERKRLVARRFIENNLEAVRRDVALISSGDRLVLEEFETLAGPLPAAS